MLVEFKVSNFRNFEDELFLDLSHSNNYEFNSDAIKNQAIKTAMIYGENASGKSNLGHAIFDIIYHLTDKERSLSLYNNYLNLNSKAKSADFYYIFRFGDGTVTYSYQKTAAMALLKEELIIDGKQVAFYDHQQHQGKSNLKGTENLNIYLNEEKISFIKYINSNSVLDSSKEGNLFKEFMNFVNSMLWFSSLENNNYIGFELGAEKVAGGIISAGKVPEFQSFLSNLGIKYDLVEREVGDEKQIYCKFKNRYVNFYSVASRGTKTLSLFYYWLIKLDKASLVFIDEFDAFYHDNLARAVITELKKRQVQAIVTTHNTSIMDNDLLRPDCYFNLVDGKITSFSSSTSKELRQAHNLSKLYKAGAFDGE